MRFEGMDRGNRWRCMVVLGSGLVALSLLAACGSNASHSGFTRAAASRSKLTKSPIKIGFINSTTGVVDGTTYRYAVDVVTAWQRWVNSTTGINGHPVEVVIKDSKNDPATTASDVQELINDGVIAEVGGQDSVTSQVFVKALTDKKIPAIGGQIPDDAVGTSSPYYFWLTPGVSIIAPLMVDSAKQLGAKNFGAVICLESSSCASAIPFWQKRAAQDGLAWGGYTKIAVGAPSYTAACLALKSADFIELAVAGSVATRLVQDCTRQGIKPRLYQSALATFDGTSVIKQIPNGVTLSGLLGGFPWWLDTPAVQQYRAVMKQYGSGVPLNTVPTATWASLEAFREAMGNASAKPTSAEVYGAMTKVHNDDLGGLLPQRVSFTAGKPSTPFRCLWAGEYKDGKYSAGEPLCMK